MALSTRFIYVVAADGKSLKQKFVHSPMMNTGKDDKKGDKNKEAVSESPNPNSSVTALTCQGGTITLPAFSILYFNFC